jgi:hypothetical protein
MAQSGEDFEKGEAGGTVDALTVLAAISRMDGLSLELWRRVREL